MYKPLEVETIGKYGLSVALEAMRLPKPQSRITSWSEDLELAGKLIKAGDDHAKVMRGVIVWYKLECQVGWLLEYVTYRDGIECLSSSSAMHDELKKLRGEPLASAKQADLPTKQYTRIETASYQALRRIYKARRYHRHPDWQIFCDWIETLPYFEYLIYPEKKGDFLESFV